VENGDEISEKIVVVEKCIGLKLAFLHPDAVSDVNLTSGALRCTIKGMTTEFGDTLRHFDSIPLAWIAAVDAGKMISDS